MPTILILNWPNPHILPISALVFSCITIVTLFVLFLSCNIFSYDILSYNILSCNIVPRNIVSCNVVSFLFYLVKILALFILRPQNKLSTKAGTEAITSHFTLDLL